MTDTANEKQGCLVAILRLFGVNRRQEQPISSTEPLPYRVRDDFLSPAEISFCHVLSSVVGSWAVICPKVRLADIFFVVRPDENLSYFNRVAQRHVDFLLCKPNSMKPVLGIELDDTSHTRPKRKQRDEFVDKVFESAGLPLLRIAAQRDYSTRELTTQIAQYLELVETHPSTSNTAAVPQPTSPQVSKPIASAPACPKCGVPMVVRTAKRGKSQGRQFYGCPNYPRCREVLPFDTRLSGGGAANHS
jgi:hypothetical protein